MDEELVRQAQKGDHVAFLELLRKHDRQIMSVVYRFTGDLYDREDLYQEIFLHCFKSIGSFRFRSSFQTWLYRVALNRCVDYMNRKPVVREVLETAVPPHDLERREKLRSVHQAMNRLQGPQRICFFLHYVEGWTVEEIQDILDVRRGTVKSHLDRARKKIRLTPEVLRWQTNPT